MPFSASRRASPFLVWAACVLAASVFVLMICRVDARDLGQWEDADPAISEWFKTLMQPDQPNISCCGQADAYWADRIVIEGTSTYAIITDPRPDEPLGRPHVDIGTKILVPSNKLKWDRGNPTGHAIIFLSTNKDVYCFVQNGGV